MNIIVSQNAGFCFGVKEALQKTIETVEKQKNNEIYTYGPLIHNKQVINKLESMGVKSEQDINKIGNNTLIIRSHGVPLDVYEQIKKNNIDVIDATCPFVRKVQKIAKDYYELGYQIIIIGDPEHPEVVGIKGWCNNTAYVIKNEEDVDNLKELEKACLVAQTTITYDLWNKVLEKLQNKIKDLKAFNTICIATQKRQTSCEDVAKQVDAMIVIGGYHSSNTQKLLQISKKYCSNTYHIETAGELPIEQIKKFNNIGITAGASTPDWIIKEVIEKMHSIEQSNNEMQNMMDEIENSLRIPRRGNTVKGKVIHVTKNEIIVNIGYKSDGIISKDEISNDPLVDPRELVKEGDEIEVYVLKTDDGEGNILLSKKRIDAEKNWENIEDTFNNKTVVEVKVIEVVNGGVIANFNEIRGFIPASQLSDSYVNNLQEFIGRKLKAKVIDVNKQKKKVVFSHRIVLEEEKEGKKQVLWNTIEKGSLVEGEVKRITNFGVFVDIGGVDGLIHISDLSWGRVSNPSEVVKIGDRVKVLILDFDKDKNKISLGLKQTTQEPWKDIDTKYEAGSVLTGKVVRLVDFGAFVELEPGVDGLVHISQISEKHIAKPSEEVHVGQQVKVKILDIDKENRRISLSIKDITEPSKDNENSSDGLNEDEEITTIGEILKSKE